MLPGGASAQRASRSMGSTYLRRLLKPQQMDLEHAFWLMMQLIISPKTAYRHTAYHKQTKNQWARDDPAFVVVTCALVAVATTAYCVTFGTGLWHSVATILAAVVVDYLLLGCAIATAAWFVCNRFLRKRNLHQHHVEQHVEWLYAFDVHCNSYFPLLLVLYVLQFLASPVLLWNSLASNALAVLMYAAALSYYWYMTFLGFGALPFLEHTEVFLWPIGAVFLVCPFAVLASFNPARFTLQLVLGL